MKPQVKKKSYIHDADPDALFHWRASAFGKGYKELASDIGISIGRVERALREGKATDETEKILNKFFKYKPAKKKVA